MVPLLFTVMISFQIYSTHTAHTDHSYLDNLWITVSMECGIPTPKTQAKCNPISKNSKGEGLRNVGDHFSFCAVTKLNMYHAKVKSIIDFFPRMNSACLLYGETPLIYTPTCHYLRLFL